MNWTQWLARWFRRARLPEHLQQGAAGEAAARAFLEQKGWRFLAANYRIPQGEIDLVFRDREILVFVEVKTRASERWERPAAAVDAKKRRRVSRAALSYLHAAGRPAVNFRFDIVEVLRRDPAPPEIRHWPNAFPLARPYRYVPAHAQPGPPRR